MNVFGKYNLVAACRKNVFEACYYAKMIRKMNSFNRFYLFIVLLSRKASIASKIKAFYRVVLARCQPCLD
jgi:hypothetical protein